MAAGAMMREARISFIPGRDHPPVLCPACTFPMETLFPAMRRQFAALFFLFLLALPILTYPGILWAQIGGKPHVAARLISEVSSVRPGGSFWVAAELTMEEGYHTYWRNPGDSGLKTEIEWRLPEGFTAGETRWPYPERIVRKPQAVYGYHGTVFLLTEIAVAETVTAGENWMLQADINWLECKKVCVPGGAELSLRIAVKDAPEELNDQFLETFSLARSRIPISSKDWQLSAAVDGDSLIIQAGAPDWMEDEPGSILFFPYQAGFIDNAAMQSWEKTADGYRVRVRLARTVGRTPDTVRGILVAEGGWRGPGSEKGLEVAVPVSANLQDAGISGPGLSGIWLALLFSFVGGMILNLMPCVLPVLSIKIMGFVHQAGDEHGKSWQHGIVFTMGVLISFWVLAGLLLVLKAGGSQLGWGFQLQSPSFLIVLSSFLLLFGLSMFGVFEIGTSLITVAGRTTGVLGFGGSFLSGVTATIVASPCTAPFMGSALGFSITQPAWVSLLVFTFIGLGMSAPYLLISSFPALLRFVPKPGRWMESLKQFMGFLLVATVIWLLWILGLQTGSSVVTLALTALLITALGAWIYGRWGNAAMPKTRRIIATTAGVMLIAGANIYALANVNRFAVQQSRIAQTAGTIQWEPWSEESVARARLEGRPLFIDFTAAWCITCQTNERVAFGSKAVQDKFRELDIRAFKADWTSRDPAITKALAEYGRNCVPLYVLYSGRPGEPPKILPEIITPGIVLGALRTIE
jgi:thiol:disulfide interchange protein/DsbC/DsbD-like thiol-disulfide interchange protein